MYVAPKCWSKHSANSWIGADPSGKGRMHRVSGTAPCLNVLLIGTCRNWQIIVYDLRRVWVWYDVSFVVCAVSRSPSLPSSSTLASPIMNAWFESTSSFVCLSLKTAFACDVAVFVIASKFVYQKQPIHAHNISYV